jgi:hypothetical protein
MTNKYLLIALLSSALIGGILTVKSRFATKSPVVMPGAGLEEGRAERRANERAMLADPATGEIPRGIKFLEQQFARDLASKSTADRSAVDWLSRGPYNVGGRSRTFVIDRTNPNRMMAGSVSGGVWLSEDAGQSWSRRTPLNAHPGCVSIAQDPRPGNTNIWYYISGELTGTSASGGGAFYLGDGMFKSTDGGSTWTVLGATDNGNQQSFTDLWQSGWRVVVNPVNGDVFAATYSCIFRSTNGGTTWTAVLGGINATPYSYYSDIAVSSTGVLYATLSSDGVKKGLWRSENGTIWTDITPANFPITYERVVLEINPNNENEVFFLADSPNAGFVTSYIENDNWSTLMKYTYLSGNGSGSDGTWVDLSQNLPQTGTQFDRFSHQGGYDLAIKVQPGTGNVFLAGTSLWRSTDGFITANNTTKIGGYAVGTELPFFQIYPNHHPDVHALLFSPTNQNVLFSASDGGLHRTDDCLAPTVQWTSLNRGYQTTQFYTAIMEKNTAGDNTLIGGLQDNGNFFTNTDNAAQPWVQTVNGDGAHGFIPAGKPFYVLSIQQGRVVKCQLDATGTVTGFQRFDPIGRVKSDYQFINVLAGDPVDQNKLYLPAGNKCYRQDDLAAIPIMGQWDSVSTGWTEFPDTLELGRYSAIAVSTKSPAHRVYLGTTSNRIYRYDNAHTGTPTRTPITSPLPDATGTTTQPYVSCIAVDPDNADDVTVVFSNYSIYSIWRSLDAGVNWKKVGGNLEANLSGTNNAPSIRWLDILPFPDGSRKYFCGTSVGLYSATTLVEHATGMPGTQWIPEGGNNIGSVPVVHIQSRASDGLVVVATHGQGMFAANFLQPSSVHNPRVAVPEVRIAPNPAADYTEFILDEKYTGPHQVFIFSADGRLLKTEKWQGNRHKIDLTTLPKQTLMYRLEGKGWQKSGKILRF